MQNWQLWAVAAALSAAITALLVKVGVQGVDAGMATLFRTLAVAIVLTLVLLVSGRLDWQELRQLPALSLGALALSALATGVSWFCYSRALQLGPVAGVAALDKLSVVLIALLAVLLLGEQKTSAPRSLEMQRSIWVLVGIARSPLGYWLLKSAPIALAQEQQQTDRWNSQPPANVPRRFQ